MLARFRVQKSEATSLGVLFDWGADMICDGNQERFNGILQYVDCGKQMEIVV